ncbi:hypothetical protein [Luteitalea sp. TBR-22]|uniref:hypothetical protein n=1 Tax=Luteitalea sp. TBR-22 TaxID=2802971 RepID=UPI001EF706A9|nr:hypothetical protein [Luteitalea sp. TBR-22]
MKKLTSTFATLVVVTALGAPAFAQAPTTTTPLPAPQQPTTQQEPTTEQPKPSIGVTPLEDDAKAEAKTLTGRLVRVDSDGMAIFIKGADDKEQRFRYTDATKVVGAQEQVSGLATKAGSLVTVHYTEGAGDVLIATKVQFDQKK